MIALRPAAGALVVRGTCIFDAADTAVATPLISSDFLKTYENIIVPPITKIFNSSL